MMEPGDAAPHSEQRFRFLTALYVALRNARAFELDSVTARTSMVGLLEAMDGLWKEEGEAALGATGNFLSLNGARVRVSLSGVDIYNYLLHELKSHQVGLLRIEPTIDLDSLTKFLFILARLKCESEEVAAELRAEMERQGVQGVALEALDVTTRAEAATTKERSGSAYFRSVQTAREAITSATQGMTVNWRSVKRAVQETVEVALHDDFYMRCLANNLRDYDEYTFLHSTNVAVLSISFGLYLAAPKRALGNLGVAALLHDVGKLLIRGDVLNANRPLTDDEWMEVREHPLHGVRALLRTPRLTESTIYSMAVCFEHHRGVVVEGYPAAEGYGAPTLFGRIVSIVDCYDALRTPRPYRPRSLTPAECYDIMLKDAGTKLDATLLRYFIEFQGLYPTGTIVELDDGQRAVVCAQAGTIEDLDKPSLRILSSDPEAEPRIIDLAAPSADRLPRIVKMQPLPCQPADFAAYIKML